MTGAATGKQRRWAASAVLLTISGIFLIGVGCYFLFLRPALLPEDIRYMNFTAAELESFGPRLSEWLSWVFRVMGGYVLATGILAITLATTSFRAHQWRAALGAMIGGCASIGWMTVVNFMINSDYKWLLLAIALTWGCSLVLFWVERAGGA
jgi:hypothetical protein